MSKSGRFHAPIGQALVCSLLGAFAFSACSSSGSSPAGTGGSSATGGSSNGGTSAVGGASVAGGSGAGGANASGGANSGGTPAAGGAGTGGASSSGGSAKGGTTGTGGAASGGASATGGAASGGASATGGSASGGTSTAGGSGAGGSGTGGSAAGGTGGKTGTTGGTTGQGGTSAAGGTSSGTGGSTGTTTCGARVLSLSANATGSATDTAYSHIEADLKTDLPIGNANRTIEFWAYIKSTDWVGEKNELYYYGSAGTAMAFGLDFGTNPVTGAATNHATLNPFTNGGFTLDSTDNLGITSSTDQWVHIAMTWNGTVLLLYANGLPKITVNAVAGSGVTALATVSSVIYIGCNPTNKNCFNGDFAEFRVWNVARTAAEILANYNKPAVGNETGLVAYYKFDDAVGATTAADSVTTAGHTAHPGALKATTTMPTFAAPPAALPLVCQ
jgi:hypothetical protein